MRRKASKPVGRRPSPKPLGLLASLAALLLIGGAVAGYEQGQPPNAAIAAAQDLFIPLACTGPGWGFRWRIGTGFPIAEHRVMTARHIDCGPHGWLELSSDRGHTWEYVAPEQQQVAKNYDIRILEVPDQTYTHTARFRTARLGEAVAGYGIAFGEIATLGFVMKSDPAQVTVSNTAIGGMSGSAIVAEDGSVLGIVVLAVPTMVGQDQPTSWVSQGVPSAVIKWLLQEPDQFAPAVQPEALAPEPQAQLQPRLPPASDTVSPTN